MKIFKTFIFWNNRDIVKYFSDKPADHRIKERLEKINQAERESMKALDLGCGGGRHTDLLVNLGFQTYAIDPNPVMLHATTKRLKSNGLKGVRRGIMTKLPYEDNIFDVVVTTGVLHQARNLAEYEQAIHELSRVVKKSGVVCLNIFTSKAIDGSMLKTDHAFSFQTKEGLYMTLLDKKCFYEMMSWNGFSLENELAEDIVSENTGTRSVLRCNFIKN